MISPSSRTGRVANLVELREVQQLDSAFYDTGPRSDSTRTVGVISHWVSVSIDTAGQGARSYPGGLSSVQRLLRFRKQETPLSRNLHGAQLAATAERGGVTGQGGARGAHRGRQLLVREIQIHQRSVGMVRAETVGEQPQEAQQTLLQVRMAADRSPRVCIVQLDAHPFDEPGIRSAGDPGPHLRGEVGVCGQDGSGSTGLQNDSPRSEQSGQ